ncbi:MAG TPA: histidine kinase [Planosporangium sp.]|nr:histidine kinase [Planosporangium sp.]
MTTGSSSGMRRGSTVAAVLGAPWSARAWLATTHLLVGVPVGVVSGGVLVILGPLTAGLAVLPCVWLFTAWQRARFAAYLGVPIQRHTGHVGMTWWRRLWAELTAATTWRQVGYHLVAGLVGAFAGVPVIGMWAGGLILSTVFVHGRLLHREALLQLDTRSPVTLGVLTGIGLLMLYGAPWAARAGAALDLGVARALLEPNSREELTRRVESLAASRADVVAAADAERRRVERDLHDGTQQRLVSLAMNLGITRATLTDLPEPALQAIAQAHEESKQALAELRDFVRGLHPAVLDDRGLDAALSGIAARSPVPVRLEVDMADRPSRTIEAIAYFVVSEALANVAKHANAARVDVVVDQPSAGRLRIAVVDDGDGGARIDGGTGLRGLARRVGSVDGTLSLHSPPGGPTRITVELPCES